MLLADVIDREIDHDLRIRTPGHRVCNRTCDQVTGNGAGWDRDLPRVILFREDLADLRKVTTQEGLASAEADPQERPHGGRGVGQALYLLERRPGHALGHLLPVEAVPAARVAAARDEQRQVQRRTALPEAAGHEGQVAQGVQASPRSRADPLS